MTKVDAIMVKENDNVATSLRDVQKGENIVIGIGDKIQQITIQELISYGHKFAVKDISIGENIVKYGEVIGRATQKISTGKHAHIHNIESLRGRGDLKSGESKHGI